MLGYKQYREDGVFSSDIIAEVAAHRELGLQLLLLDAWDDAMDSALPKTLHILFVKWR